MKRSAIREIFHVGWARRILPEPTDLNKLSFKTTLWLPAEVAIELSKRLQNKPDAKSPFDLVLMARRVHSEDTSLKPEHVTYWDAALEKLLAQNADKNKN
jgi:hypothetical protein